jgi:hypothetical protein
MNKTREYQNGILNIMGTDWPIYSTIDRIGRGKWRLTTDICNGTSISVTHYSTLRAAQEALLGIVRVVCGDGAVGVKVAQVQSST